MKKLLLLAVVGMLSVMSGFAATTESQTDDQTFTSWDGHVFTYADAKDWDLKGVRENLNLKNEFWEALRARVPSDRDAKKFYRTERWASHLFGLFGNLSDQPLFTNLPSVVEFGVTQWIIEWVFRSRVRSTPSRVNVSSYEALRKAEECSKCHNAMSKKKLMRCLCVLCIGCCKDHHCGDTCKSCGAAKSFSLS